MLTPYTPDRSSASLVQALCAALVRTVSPDLPSESIHARKVIQTISVHTKFVNRLKVTHDGKRVLISDSWQCRPDRGGCGPRKEVLLLVRNTQATEGGWVRRIWADVDCALIDRNGVTNGGKMAYRLFQTPDQASSQHQEWRIASTARV